MCSELLQGTQLMSSSDAISQVHAVNKIVCFTVDIQSTTFAWPRAAAAETTERKDYKEQSDGNAKTQRNECTLKRSLAVNTSLYHAVFICDITRCIHTGRSRQHCCTDISNKMLHIFTMMLDNRWPRFWVSWVNQSKQANYKHMNQLISQSAFCTPTHAKLELMPDETDAKKILTASPLENWRRSPGCTHTTWLKTIQQDLKSDNLSLNEGNDVAQNHPLWRDWCLRLALRTPSGACHERRRRRMPRLSAQILIEYKCQSMAAVMFQYKNSFQFHFLCQSFLYLYYISTDLNNYFSFYFNHFYLTIYQYCWKH